MLELPCVFPDHLGDVPELAPRFPRLAIVIDHLGKPPLRSEQMRSWEALLRAAAGNANVSAKISGLNTMIDAPDWGAADLRRPVEVAVRLLRRRPASLRQRLAGGAAERRLHDRLAGDRPRRRRRRARVTPNAYLRARLARLYRIERKPAATSTRPPEEPMAAPLTDQAIAKIKDLIMSGEFAADSKLPKEQELAQRLGLSRNSLREAVRALTLIGVLEPRVGDGTYVTSLEPELLLTGMGFISDLLTGPTLLELHQVRRILEPVATGMATLAADRGRLRGARGLPDQMDAAETTQAFIAADEEFHRIIVVASGNSTLASLIQNLSGGTLRARLWRSRDRARRDRVDEEPAPGHLRGTACRRRRAGERRRPGPSLRRRAVAAADGGARRGGRPGPRSGRRAGRPVVKAVTTSGPGSFAVVESRADRARAGRGRARRRLLRHVRHRPAHRPRQHGPPCPGAAGDRSRDVGHGGRGGRRRRGLRGRRRGRRPPARHAWCDDGRTRRGAHRQTAELPRDRYTGSVPGLLDRPGLHVRTGSPPAPTSAWRRSPSRSPSRATTCGAARCAPATWWS